MSKKDWVGTKDSAFKMLGASSHSKEDREENDFYATDPEAIDYLLKHETFFYRVWECACGQGHLSERLKKYGYDVLSSDIIYRNYKDTEIIDFLKVQKEDIKYDEPRDIITNPPYKYCSEFILKALDLVNDNGKIAMFLKLQTLEGQKRYEELFSKHPPKTIYVFSKRIQCGKNGVFEGSSAVCYAWFVWQKGFKGDPVIKWIY